MHGSVFDERKYCLIRISVRADMTLVSVYSRADYCSDYHLLLPAIVICGTLPPVRVHRLDYLTI